jgi:hypothetical protein
MYPGSESVTLINVTTCIFVSKDTNRRCLTRKGFQPHWIQNFHFVSGCDTNAETLTKQGKKIQP